MLREENDTKNRGGRLVLVELSGERGKEQRGKVKGTAFWVPRATSDVKVRPSAGRQRRESRSYMNRLTLSLDYTWNEMMKNKKKRKVGNIKTKL